MLLLKNQINGREKMNKNKRQLKELQTGGPGFWMGVAALVGSIFLVPAGLICGIIGKKESEDAGYKNNFALAGIIISSVFMGLGLLTWIIFAVFAGSMFNEIKDIQKDSINAESSIQQQTIESTSASQQAALDAARARLNQ